MKTLAIWMSVFVAAVAGAVPQYINYQGSLTRPDGSPSDTTVAMTFKLWSASSSGTLLWTESESAVGVAGGLFSVSLGQNTALPDSILNRAQVWLGISVGGDPEMTPRTQIVSVGYSYRVGTIDGASGGTVNGDVNVVGEANIGFSNTNPGLNSFVVGTNDHARGSYSTVAGGGGGAAADSNTARGNYSTVAGGRGNYAFQDYGTVGGGFDNSALGNSAAVGGGQGNNASDYQTTIAGGFLNRASGSDAVVAGGEQNTASGFAASLVGGAYNAARGNFSFVGGGGSTLPSDSNSATGVNSAVTGGRHNLAAGTASSVGGGSYNYARADYTTVGGGGGPAAIDSNSAVGDRSTVGGGQRNATLGVGATVSGGINNTASGTEAVVGGGSNNLASGILATVSGGNGNTAAGYSATIPGGFNCVANGDYSFVVGRNVKATGNANGTFVWGDNYGLDTLVAGTANRVVFRAANGYRLYTADDLSAGVLMNAGDGAWSALSDSTKKANIRRVNTAEVLEEVSKLPVSEWNYRAQNAGIRHMGPMAQDFYAVFHLGDSDTTISTLDPDGVALAAIQELAKRNQQLEETVATLQRQMQALQAEHVTSQR